MSRWLQLIQNIFSSIDFKLCPCKGAFLIYELLFLGIRKQAPLVAVKDFAFLLHGQFPDNRFVLIFHGDDCLISVRISLIERIGIHRHFHIIFVQHISVRCCHFLNAVDMQKDENGNRTKYYSKGDLVATLTTGKDGKAGLSGIPMGQYRVVETKAPYGYVLNGEEQLVTFVYVDDKTPVIYESVTFANDRQKLDMSVIKKDAEEDTPVAGAVFGLFAAEDIENANEEVCHGSPSVNHVAVFVNDCKHCAG